MCRSSPSSLTRAWSEKIPILSIPDSQAVSIPLTRVVLVAGSSVHPVNWMLCAVACLSCGLSCTLQATIKRDIRTVGTVFLKFFIPLELLPITNPFHPNHRFSWNRKRWNLSAPKSHLNF
ncbi:MAG: hypothetical protein PHE07_04075 [Bacteroidales bacterium]|nr:hypothetical protein [Bacteroidales bacterium]